MKYTHLSLSLLLGVVACSSYKPSEKFQGPVRTVASLDLLNERGLMDKKIEKLTQSIFQSYLMGQVYLNEFDAILDKDPSKAMESSAYDKLLAVRTFVDQFEEEISDLYMDLVMVASHPKYSEEQRENAKSALKVIGNFMEGVKSDKTLLPENLKPMVLNSIREDQTSLYEDLKVLKGNITFTEGLTEVEKNIHEQMVLLRATRLDYHKDLSKYHVDPAELQKALEHERSSLSFKKLEQDILNVSKDMKKFRNVIGRGTSAASIFPSAGSNGNITGSGFPANTWSITYDDGPGKTSPQVLKNLVDKKIPATFFQLAKQVIALPGTALAIKDAGMDMASHSYDHAQLTKLGPQGLEKQITEAKKVLESKLGVTIKLFRLPYGAGVSNAAIRKKIAANKMIHVFWNVDTLDWQDKNPQSIYNRAVKQMKGSSKNAGVVLFHDIHSQTVTASAMLMDYMNANKINACTVQGVVDQINEGKPSCK